MEMLCSFGGKYKNEDAQGKNVKKGDNLCIKMFADGYFFFKVRGRGGGMYIVHNILYVQEVVTYFI